MKDTSKNVINDEKLDKVTGAGSSFRPVFRNTSGINAVHWKCKKCGYIHDCAVTWCTKCGADGEGWYDVITADTISIDKGVNF